MRRRDFLTKTLQGAAALAAASAPLGRRAHASISPNEKITVAVIGCGGMGSRHLEILSANPEVNLAAVCDVYKPRYLDWADKVEKISGKKPDGYQDFREVLDRKDIDAVFVVTPDHWHALLTILACQAGKDVYVEKPVCTAVEEGRAMVETARRYGRVVQAGTQQRSMPVFQEAVRILQSGQLGQVTHATAWVGINEWGVGETPGPIPEGLDWDLWLGPAPYVPYSPERQYGFMGWWDYARGGQLTNWGTHLMDIVHWGIGHDRPLSVYAVGGNYRGRAGADNPETVEGLFEYPDFTVTWEQRPWNIHANKGYGIKFQGTEGQLFVDRATVVVKPEKIGIKEIVGAPEKSWANPEHHANFFHCIRTRERPVADIEQGFRSTTAVLLGGIALKTKRKLAWDGESETFLRDEQANRYLSRPYRPPWHL